MPVSAQEYNAKLKTEMARFKGDRDKAVRATNVATGYGNSTALKHRVGGGAPATRKAAPAAAKAAPTKARKTDRTKTASTSPFKLSPGQMTRPVPPAGNPAAVLAGSTGPYSGAPQPPMSPAAILAGASGPYSGAAQPPAGPIGAGAGLGLGAASGLPVPMNPALSQASILQTQPPELLAGPQMDYQSFRDRMARLNQPAPVSSLLGNAPPPAQTLAASPYRLPKLF